MPPLEWDGPPPPSRPKKTKQPRGRSGKGDGTTVGMAIVIFGSAALVAVGAFGYVIYGWIVA